MEFIFLPKFFLLAGLRLHFSESLLSRSRLWRFSTRARREEAEESAWTERQGTWSIPRSWARLEDPALLQKAVEQILADQLTVAQTERLVELLLSPPPEPAPKPKRTIILKDVRLFLNTLSRSVDLMRSAGVDAQCQR